MKIQKIVVLFVLLAASITGFASEGEVKNAAEIAQQQVITKSVR